MPRILETYFIFYNKYYWLLKHNINRIRNIPIPAKLKISTKASKYDHGAISLILYTLFWNMVDGIIIVKRFRSQTKRLMLLGCSLEFRGYEIYRALFTIFNIYIPVQDEVYLIYGINEFAHKLSFCVFGCNTYEYLRWLTITRDNSNILISNFTLTGDIDIIQPIYKKTTLTDFSKILNFR